MDGYYEIQIPKKFVRDGEKLSDGVRRYLDHIEKEIAKNAPQG